MDAITRHKLLASLWVDGALIHTDNHGLSMRNPTTLKQVNETEMCKVCMRQSMERYWQVLWPWEDK
jgi:hypothetical protein